MMIPSETKQFLFCPLYLCLKNKKGGEQLKKGENPRLNVTRRKKERKKEREKKKIKDLDAMQMTLSLSFCFFYFMSLYVLYVSVFSKVL